MRATGRIWLPSRPAFVYGSTSIFREDATKLARSSSQELKEKFANQAYYNDSAQSGKFYGYEGYGYGGIKHGCSVNWNSFTVARYLMPPNAPRVKVWYVKGDTEEVQPEGESTNLQAEWLSVPVPNPANLALGELSPAGTDKAVSIACPATGEEWEFHAFSQFLTGPHMGEWKAGYGAYTNSSGTFNGVWPHGWGSSSSGFGFVGGAISLQDLVNVLRGQPIGHALACAVPVNNGTVKPSTRAGEVNANTHKFMEDGKTANPAFGAMDEVPHGLWMAFPAGSNPEEFGIKKSKEPLAYAMYVAGRDHGWTIRDHAGEVAFYINDPRVLGAPSKGGPPPYAETAVNPFAGCESLGEEVVNYIKAYTGMTDPTLPALTETFFSTTSVFSKMPFRELEQLEPRSSRGRRASSASWKARQCSWAESSSL